MNLTGYPDPKLAKEVKRLVDNKLIESFIYLLQVAEKGIKTSTIEIQERLKGQKNKKLSSLAYLYHTKLKQFINEQSVDGVNKLIKNIADGSTFLSHQIQVDSIEANFFSREENKLLIDVFKYGYSTTYNKEPDLRALENDVVLHHVRQAQKAIDTIKLIDPLSFDEIQKCVSEILIYESNFMNSGSSFNTLGLITMNNLIEEQNWTTYLEIIIHEAAHLHLYNIMVYDKLFDNKNEYFFSPLRQEKRPMIGIFHGMFVLSRIIRTFNLLDEFYLNSEDKPKVVFSYNNSRNNTPHIQKFESLYNTVINNARLTSWGEKIVADCKRMTE